MTIGSTPHACVNDPLETHSDLNGEKLWLKQTPSYFTKESYWKFKFFNRTPFQTPFFIFVDGVIKNEFLVIKWQSWWCHQSPWFFKGHYCASFNFITCLDTEIKGFTSRSEGEMQYKVLARQVPLIVTFKSEFNDSLRLTWRKCLPRKFFTKRMIKVWFG